MFIGCINDFVRLNFNTTTSTFSCIFLNKLNNNSETYCSIVFGICNKELTKMVEGYATTENPSSILLNLTGLLDETYCYNVIASHGATIVKVEGKIIKGKVFVLFRHVSLLLHLLINN